MSSYRSQLIVAMEPLEHAARTQATTQSIHVDIIAVDAQGKPCIAPAQFIGVTIEVFPRHKQVFGKRMVGYRLKFDNAELQRIVAANVSGQFFAFKWTERKSTFIKFAVQVLEKASEFVFEQGYGFPEPLSRQLTADDQVLLKDNGSEPTPRR